LFARAKSQKIFKITYNSVRYEKRTSWAVYYIRGYRVK
jgi:hypothetical protein